MGAGPSRPAAIPPHLANGGKPPIPTPTTGAYRFAERDSPAPATPLRPIQELREGDLLIDESLDGEFINFEDGFVLETIEVSDAVTRCAFS